MNFLFRKIKCFFGKHLDTQIAHDKFGMTAISKCIWCGQHFFISASGITKLKKKTAEIMLEGFIIE